MKLSIVAIKNHPDICGVVEYLENLDLVPAQYGDLAFAMPSENYADTFDAPIEWYMSKRGNCVVVNPDTGMSAYVAYSKSANTIVALADVLSGTAEMPSPDEQAIALHIINLLEKNGYYMAYHPADVLDPTRPYKDWMENIDYTPKTAMDKEITRILKALFEPDCPFCSGKEVSFGSSQLTVKKEEGLAVVYYDEGVAANFKWKFCPECGKNL